MYLNQRRNQVVSTPVDDNSLLNTPVNDNSLLEVGTVVKAVKHSNTPSSNSNSEEVEYISE